jgi:DNA-binding response OmpR family regulator
MTVMEKPMAPLVAILNGSSDILEALEEYLRGEGLITITAIVTEFKKGRADFIDFMQMHKPAVILYDVQPPYDENMTFLRLLMDTHSMEDQCVILTTTNKSALEKVTGEANSIEIIGKPFDLDLLIREIRAKLKSCTKLHHLNRNVESIRRVI